MQIPLSARRARGRGDSVGKILRVGVFDSGIGGLTVLAACRKRLPYCRFYYFGDNARAPYGSRPREEITSFVFEGMRRFARLGTDAAVLACNTATAVCAERVRAAFPFPVVGVEPAVRPAALKYRRVLVLATPRTAESARLRALVARFPQSKIEVCALPALAGEIERALTRGERLTISDHLPQGTFGGVVLGCTHYAFFRAEIADFYGCEVFDGAEGTARRLGYVLAAGGQTPQNGIGDHLRPPLFPQNTNICFNQNPEDTPDKGVIFLGKGRKINQFVYNTNICFRKR